MNKVIAGIIGVLLIVGVTHGATITKVPSTTEDTWHSGGASLASNANVLSNAVVLTNPGYLGAWCILNVPTFSTTVTAGTAVTVWFSVSTDGGTTYPDGGSGVTPAGPPDMYFPLRAVSTQQVVGYEVKEGRVPTGAFKVLIRNEGTGATMNTTWTLKCKTNTLQSN